MEKNISVEDNREFKILDIQQGACTAAGLTDKVFLIAFMSMEGALQSDITVVIKNEGVLIKAAPRVSEGYDSAIFCGRFMNTWADQVLLSISSGDAGSLTHHYLYSFYNQTTVLLFDSEYFNKRSQYRLVYKDGFKAVAVHAATGEKHLIDLQTKPKKYLSLIYDAQGRMIREVQGAVTAVTGLYPVYSESYKRHQLLACQRITGLNDSDTLGYLISRLNWNGREFQVIDTYTSLSPHR